MPQFSVGCTLVSVIVACLSAGPALAGGANGPEGGYQRHAPARALPPEFRYRDPRYVPPRRLPPRFVPPTELIHAYLPRPTNTPIYNEPPTRFPAR